MLAVIEQQQQLRAQLQMTACSGLVHRQHDTAWQEQWQQRHDVLHVPHHQARDAACQRILLLHVASRALGKKEPKHPQQLEICGCLQLLIPAEEAARAHLLACLRQQDELLANCAMDTIRCTLTQCCVQQWPAGPRQQARAVDSRWRGGSTILT